MESFAKESHREELEKKIIAAFKTFDHESNNSVDVREIGTIIRSLGCCPSEADLKVIIEEVEDDEPTSYIHLDKFLPIVTKIIEDNRHPSATYDQLLQCCLTLDSTNKGYLTWDELKHYFVTAGEPFTEEEMDTLASTSLIANNQHIDYREWITWLVPDKSSQT